MRIVTNAYLGRKRTEKRRPTPVEIDDVPDHFLYLRSRETGAAGVAEDPVEEFLRGVDVAEIEAAIQNLPAEFRGVAALYFGQEFTYPEISELLDIPVGTVRSRLHRARKLLQKELWDMAVEEGIIHPGEEDR
jgi:RNA polymerase sigma-70 factor (ECF subfamily)